MPACPCLLHHSQVHFGQPSEEEKRAFTLVLKGTKNTTTTTTEHDDHHHSSRPQLDTTERGAHVVPACLSASGHIALAQARFPEGTMGHKLDILARLPLWSQGLDYKHGTGSPPTYHHTCCCCCMLTHGRREGGREGPVALCPHPPIKAVVTGGCSPVPGRLVCVMAGYCIGHGVGAFLNVHEGPQSISYKKRAYEEGLYPGR